MCYARTRALGDTFFNEHHFFSYFLPKYFAIHRILLNFVLIIYIRVVISGRRYGHTAGVTINTDIICCTAATFPMMIVDVDVSTR